VTDFTLILEQSSTTGWKITIVTSQAISNGAQVTVPITNPSVAEGAQFINDSASGFLSSHSAPSTSEEQQASAIGAVATAASTTAVTASTVAGLYREYELSLGLVNNIQIIGLIPKMDINLPLGLKSFFVSVMDIKTIPNFLAYFEHLRPEEMRFRREFGSVLQEFKNDKGLLSCT
jgi:hypothetical protein